MSSQTLHCLLLPLNGFHLVLPQPAIAEIAPRPEVVAATESADWLIGVFNWRAEQVPLISYEKLCGEASGAAKRNRHVAILHALGGDADLVYYAIELKAIPHPVLLTPANLSAASGQAGRNDAIAADVMIGGHRAVIPALEGVEELIRSELGPLAARP
jgi:chemosensory pili system protein ChpC